MIILTVNMSNIKIKVKTRLFPYIDDINLMNGLQIDQQSIRFISLREDAEKITELILDELPNDNELIITDATAGVGGNTISFGMNDKFKYINAIEIDYIRFKYLENNISIYNLDNINTYNKDCTEILSKLYSDIVFIDAPWGGKDYKKEKNVRLSLSNISIEDICLSLMGNIKMAALKLPLNYDMNFLNEKFVNYNVKTHKLNKMYLVLIKNF